MPIIAGVAVVALSLIGGAFLVRFLTVHPLQMSSSLFITCITAFMALAGLLLNFVHVALAAAEKLQLLGISAEVIDPRTTSPLDKETLIASAKKTSRAIVIDEGYESYGVTAELASVIADGAFYYLEAPVKRMGAMDVPVPFSPALDQTVPTPETVMEVAKTLCGRV